MAAVVLTAVVLTAAALTAPSATGQVLVDNIGSEFFVGFMPNEHEDKTTTELLITADAATDVTIQYPAIDPTFETTVTVMPGAITLVDLGADPAFSWTPGAVDSNVVRVSAPTDFTLYATNRQDASTDVAVALPVDALGQSYIVHSYHQYYEYGSFAVVAVHDNTTVTITPAVDIVGGYPADTPFDITLNRGEAFLGQTLGKETSNENDDLTGTTISADKPVQVSEGHVCAAVPSPTGSCDHLFEFAQPVSGWTSTAVAAPVPDRPIGTYYRVLAAYDGTNVTRNDTTLATLNTGEFYDTALLKGPQVFEADGPISVVQFISTIYNTSGDPSMVYVLDPAQYLHEYTFATIGDAQFGADYVTIIAENADISAGAILLDGAAVPSADFTAIAGTDYAWATVEITDGTHTTESIEPHGVTIMGYDPFDTYLYNGGLQFYAPEDMSVAPSPNRVFELGSNYPNPFGRVTRIPFSLNEAAHVRLDVYDIRGRRVATLIDQVLPPGEHAIDWSGRTGTGQSASAGVYLYRLRAGSAASAGSMVLVRNK